MSNRSQARARKVVRAVRINGASAGRQAIADLEVDRLRDLVVFLAERTDLGAVMGTVVGPTVPELVDEAVTLAARRFGASHEDVLSKMRDQHLAEARQVVFYALRLAVRMSYPEIARAIGPRDHTTVMHGVAKVGETPRLRLIATEIAAQLGWERNPEEQAS